MTPVLPSIATNHQFHLKAATKSGHTENKHSRNGCQRNRASSGLDDFRLSLTGLTRLGDRPVRLSVPFIPATMRQEREIASIHLKP
jgi:hypothetical protein